MIKLDKIKIASYKTYTWIVQNKRKEVAIFYSNEVILVQSEQYFQSRFLAICAICVCILIKSGLLRMAPQRKRKKEAFREWRPALSETRATKRTQSSVLAFAVIRDRGKKTDSVFFRHNFTPRASSYVTNSPSSNIPRQLLSLARSMTERLALTSGHPSE